MKTGTITFTWRKYGKKIVAVRRKDYDPDGEILEVKVVNFNAKYNEMTAADWAFLIAIADYGYDLEKIRQSCPSITDTLLKGGRTFLRAMGNPAEEMWFLEVKTNQKVLKPKGRWRKVR